MPVANKEPVCIGVDWGTSSFRAWLFDKSGSILDSVQGPWGITQVADKPFKQTLMEAVGGWLAISAADLPVIMCGMIGSAQGWQEARYLSGRIGLDELASGVVSLDDPDINIAIIPGIQGVSADGHNDVMRGEETLLAGKLTSSENKQMLFCLPGTHSKWVLTDQNRIDRLTTFMTGELFQLMRKNSILSPLIDKGINVEVESDGFAQGLALAESPSGVLHQLFAIRAGVLTGRFKRADVPSLLSALLIGSECLAARKSFGQDAFPLITLMSSGDIASAYRTAFMQMKFQHIIVDSEQSAQAGLFAVFQRLS